MNVVQQRLQQTYPMAKPEQVGLSSVGLERLSAVMRREVDAKRVPGVTMLISRLRQGGLSRRASGRCGRRSGHALGRHLPHLFDDKPIVSVAAMMLSRRAAS